MTKNTNESPKAEQDSGSEPEITERAIPLSDEIIANILGTSAKNLSAPSNGESNPKNKPDNLSQENVIKPVISKPEIPLSDEIIANILGTSAKNLSVPSNEESSNPKFKPLDNLSEENSSKSDILKPAVPLSDEIIAEILGTSAKNLSAPSNEESSNPKFKPLDNLSEENSSISDIFKPAVPLSDEIIADILGTSAKNLYAPSNEQSCNPKIKPLDNLSEENNSKSDILKPAVPLSDEIIANILRTSSANSLTKKSDPPKDESPTKNKPIDKVSSPPNMPKPTALIAINVPKKYLDKRFLKPHFEKFGKVNRVYIDKTDKAMIYFDSHEAALKAKTHGKQLHPNLDDLMLLFKPPSTPKPTYHTDSAFIQRNLKQRSTNHDFDKDKVEPTKSIFGTDISGSKFSYGIRTQPPKFDINDSDENKKSIFGSNMAFKTLLKDSNQTDSKSIFGSHFQKNTNTQLTHFGVQTDAKNSIFGEKFSLKDLSKDVKPQSSIFELTQSEPKNSIFGTDYPRNEISNKFKPQSMQFNSDKTDISRNIFGTTMRDETKRNIFGSNFKNDLSKYSNQKSTMIEFKQTEKKKNSFGISDSTKSNESQSGTSKGLFKTHKSEPTVNFSKTEKTKTELIDRKEPNTFNTDTIKKVHESSKTEKAKTVLIDRKESNIFNTDTFKKVPESGRIEESNDNDKGLPSKTKDIPEHFNYKVKKEFYKKASELTQDMFSNEDSLKNCRANTSYDRYVILDARDKIIRSKKTSVTDVKSAQYLAASCPDMCPEKERYIRDVQGDVSMFEMVEGKMDHKLVVKKFSRSSADKEEPLPHELRPGHILRKTMDYLLCNIVDKMQEENIAVDIWYNYLWNRTRALRNEIMQQHLVDSNAIYILERSIRFHIHSAHAFCEEPPEMFDSKMNTEHLSKSMHSLKELYHDLAEEDYFSKSEPEFRSYEILLNVHDGNVVHTYQNFREEIRKSAQVQFAIEVMHAYHSNNFVKFFHLAQSAAYLQACILHKYFKLLRIKALNVIFKSYKFPSANKFQTIPIDSLLKMIGICSEEELQPIITAYNLSICQESNSVRVMKYKLEALADLKVKKDSAILNKKGNSIAVIIHNDCLPSNPINAYNPHSSFTDDGCLTEKAINANDQKLDPQYIVRSPSSTMSRQSSRSDIDLEKRIMNRVKVMCDMKLLYRHFHYWLDFTAQCKQIKKFKEKRQRKLCQKYVNIWKTFACVDSPSQRKAEMFQIKRIFSKWRTYVLYVRQLKSYKQEAIKIEKNILLRKYVNQWKVIVAHRRRANRMLLKRKKFLARKYIMLWSSYVITCSLSRDADEYFNRKLLVRTFRDWRNWVVLTKAARTLNTTDFPATSGQTSVEKQNCKWKWGFSRKSSQNLNAVQLMQLDSKIAFSLFDPSTHQVNSNPLPFVDNFQEFIDSSMNYNNILCNYIRIYLRISNNFREKTQYFIKHKFNIGRKRNVEFIDETITLKSKNFNYNFVIRITEDASPCKNSIIINAFPKIDRKQLTTEEYCVFTYELQDNTIGSNIFKEKELYLPQTDNDIFYGICTSWKKHTQEIHLRASKCNTLFVGLLSKVVFNPVNKILSMKFASGCRQVQPSIIVEFYNEYLSHLVKSILNLGSHLPPCDIFDGNSLPIISSETLSSAGCTLKLMTLPPLYVDPHISLEQLAFLMSGYCDAIIEDWGDDLKSEVYLLLEKFKPSSDSDEFDALCLPWAEIVTALINYKASILEENYVIYEESIINSFYPSQDYLSYLEIFKIERISEVTVSEPCNVVSKRKFDDSNENTEPKRIKSQLLDEIQLEKQKMKELEERLERELLKISKHRVA